MPNHVTNRVELRGSAEDVAAFQELMFVERDEHGEKIMVFDFGQIVPMPSYMEDITKGSISERFFHILKRDDEMKRSWDWMNQYRDNCLGPIESIETMSFDELCELLTSVDAGNLDSAVKMMRAEEETGYTDWYEWSIAKWGTKWNSYSFEVVSEDPCAFKFDTAWSPPIPVFEALAERFPNLGIFSMCFDEGHGFACEGWFNPPEGEEAYHEVDPSDEMYEKVYGSKPDFDDEDEEGLDDDIGDDADGDDDSDDNDQGGDKPIWAN